MNRRSILAAYKKKSSHFQTGVTGFKSGNLFNYINRNAPAAAMFPVIPNHQANNVLRCFCPCKEIFFANIQRFGYVFGLLPHSAPQMGAHVAAPILYEKV